MSKPRKDRGEVQVAAHVLELVPDYWIFQRGTRAWEVYADGNGLRAAKPVGSGRTLDAALWDALVSTGIVKSDGRVTRSVESKITLLRGDGEGL